MKESNRLFRWLFYLLGLLILAVGLTLNTKTGQGVTPIVSVPYCISQLSGLTFGNMTLSATLTATNPSFTAWSSTV